MIRTLPGIVLRISGAWVVILLPLCGRATLRRAQPDDMKENARCQHSRRRRHSNKGLTEDMPELSERLNTPISTAELERRWKAVRAAMEREKIDVLVMQNNNDHMGGYVKYFTDIPAGNGYPNTVVFPRDDRMTLVTQGPFDGVQKLPPAGDGMRRGVKQVLTTPSYASALYTSTYDPALAAKALAPFAKATIGLVCTYQMGFATGDYLKREFPNAQFVDATDMVDAIKSIKSPEELELIRKTALMQDGAMKAAFK